MTLRIFIELLPDAVCVAICAVAAGIDVRKKIIPNWLSLPSIAAGLALNFALTSFDIGLEGGLKNGLVPSFAGCAVLFVVFLALNAIGAMGMGDVKLMAAVGAFLRWPLALQALVFVLLSGAALSLIHAVVFGQFTKVVSNIPAAFKDMFKRKQALEKTELHYMPYGLAVLIGAASAVLCRYFEIFTLW
jgi:prepilin peptidase CpaA